MRVSPNADRCILTVHAHPDDESSKGAAMMAAYEEAGFDTTPRGAFPDDELGKRRASRKIG